MKSYFRRIAVKLGQASVLTHLLPYQTRAAARSS
jgi:hypothetical protein